MAYDGSIIFDTEINQDGFDAGVKSLGESATKAGKAFAPISAGAAVLFTGLIANTQATQEYVTEMAKLDTAFSQSGFTAEQASSTYSDMFAILGETDTAVEASNLLAKLATTQEDLTNWTTISTGVFATFGDSLPIESLIEAANETAKTGELTGSLADALNWAGIKEDDFKAKLALTNSESERQKLITETLTGLYGDAAGKYREVNAEVIRANEIQVKLNDAMASLGQTIQPIINDFMESFVDVLGRLATWLETVDEDTIKWGLGVLGLVAVVAPLLLLIGQMAEGFLAVKGILALLTPVMATATGATVATGVASTVASVGVGLLSAAIAFITSPIGLAVLAIGTIIYIIHELWQDSEAFREFWISVWQKITAAPKKALADIKADVKEWAKIGTAIIDAVFGGLKAGWSNIENWLNDKFGGIDDKIKSWGLGGGTTKAQDSRRKSGYATGLGFVGQDMTVNVHRGEKIVPANQSGTDTALLQQMVSQLDRLTQTVYNQPYTQQKLGRMGAI